MPGIFVYNAHNSYINPMPFYYNFLRIVSKLYFKSVSFCLTLRNMSSFNTPQQYGIYVNLLFETLFTTFNLVRLFKQRPAAAYPPPLPFNIIFKATFVIITILSLIVFFSTAFSFAILSWKNNLF